MRKLLLVELHLNGDNVFVFSVIFNSYLSFFFVYTCDPNVVMHCLMQWQNIWLLVRWVIEEGPHIVDDTIHAKLYIELCASTVQTEYCVRQNFLFLAYCYLCNY